MVTPIVMEKYCTSKPVPQRIIDALPRLFQAHYIVDNKNTLLWQQEGVLYVSTLKDRQRGRTQGRPIAMAMKTEKGFDIRMLGA
jgi:hypothetical protein